MRRVYTAHLAAVSLFTDCSRSELQRIASIADELDDRAGTVIVQQGRTGHELYLVLEGAATVWRDGDRVAELGPGDYFGELGLLARAERDASVVAATDVHLLVIGQRPFLALVDEVPRLATKMLRLMAHRLRASDLDGLPV